MSNKIIKKGTTVILKMDVDIAGCEREEEFTLENDMTERELHDLAYSVALESYQVDGWFELTEEGELQ